MLRRTTACVVEHGSRYGVAHDGSASEHYTGRVEVDRRTFAQRAEAEVAFELSWPGTEVATTSRLDLRAGPDSYEVVVELTAVEDGAVVAERRWERTVPRRLQ